MRKYILFLSACVIIFSSCTVFYGVNYNNSDKAKNLRIGMSKNEAISIMGNKYIIESTSQEEDGLLEIVKYYSSNEIPYLLHFLNDKLIVFNRYYPPYTPEQKITIKKEE